MFVEKKHGSSCLEKNNKWVLSLSLPKTYNNGRLEMGDTPSRPLSPYMLWHLCYTNFILQLFVVNHHGCRRNPQSCRSKKKHAVLFTGKTPYLFTSAVLVLSLWLSLSLSLSRSLSLSLSLYLSQSPSNKDCIFVAKKHCVVGSIPILAEWLKSSTVGWFLMAFVGEIHVFLARHQFILHVSGK